MYQVLENKFYLGNNSCNDKYLIQMRSQAISSSIKLPEVHGVCARAQLIIQCVDAGQLNVPFQ